MTQHSSQSSPLSSQGASSQPSGGSAALEFLRGYQPAANGYDEVFVRPGEARPHWKSLLQELQQVGHDEFRRRWDHSCVLVHENGIAYSAFGDPNEKARPWELDPFPLLIPHQEWQVISEGLQQRAELLNLILSDLYGPQTLVSDGFLPPEILFRHPGFRRPYHGMPVPLGRWLHSYAVDLGRSTDGQWWVMADRTEAPSGLGFALENRVVLSRMLPICFRQANVRRLASYFMRMQETMRKLSPRQRDNPRVVILSQGPGSRNYFEDAYLARYLGYTLVEGDDLAVRCNEVTLKTLSGLLPVDVILRRPNSEKCDSLELDGQAEQGAPGLLEVARAHNVGIANALGSGLVESPIFMAFLPTLAQHLLKSPLKLPGVATWWCGLPEHRRYVLEHFDQLILKPAFRQRGRDAIKARELNRLPAAELKRRVEASPQDFVAQERIARSSMPRWRQDGTFQSVYVALRAFVSAGAQEYHVLQGGLTRTSTAADPLERSLAGGEGSKDTWILSPTPVDQVSLLPMSGEVLKLVRSSGDLPSRVADNLYWLGRHLERADSTARLLRTAIIRITSESGTARFADLPHLLRCLAEQGQIEPGFAIEGIKEQMPAIEGALPAAVLDPAQSTSLRSIVDTTIRIASRVRDRLSVDSWRAVAQLDANFRGLSGKPDLSDLLNVVNELIIDLAAFGGLVTESMTRTHAYRFVELGRRLERSLQILTLVNCCFLDGRQPPVPNELLESVLEIADSRMTYRSRYLATLQLQTVLDLLLTDETNPRALAYQLSALKDHVMGLPRLTLSPGLTPDQRLVMSMQHAVNMADIESIVETFLLGDPTALRTFVESLLAQLPLLSNAVNMRYLVHAGPSQLLGDLVPSRGGAAT